MVAKKKKITTKKKVKTAVKKVIKPKKTAQKVAAKSTKKAIKKPVTKSTKKAIKKTVAAKKAITKSQPSKKIVAKKVPVQKAVLKQPVKIVKAVPEKAKTPQTVGVIKTTPRKIEKTIIKKETVKEMGRLIPKMDEYSATEAVDFIEGGMTPPTKATTLLGALEFTPYQPSQGEAYMNEQQRVHFRKILNAWKQQLMQDVDTTVGHLKEDAVFYADPVDRASQEEGFNLELRTRDRERRLIKKIEQSLDLINNGEYGFCEDCGADIGVRRLEARPTAVKCIDCKTFQEIREKQMGG